MAVWHSQYCKKYFNRKIKYCFCLMLSATGCWTALVSTCRKVFLYNTTDC